MAFEKFPSLESFGHIWRNKSAMLGGPVIEYRSKIKLHGTNAAIRIDNDGVYAQKRTSDITPGSDNAGFANWLEPRKDAWRAVMPSYSAPIVFHGEWAGPGVQRGDAVAQLAQKYFFIFSLQIGDQMIVDPDEIATFLPEDTSALDDVLVLPWSSEPAIVIDFSDPAKADQQAAFMTEAAERVGVLDPFIADVFGVEGPGEGHVWVPVPEGQSYLRDYYSSHVFKVKAARHGAKKAKAASRKVEIPAGAKEFVEMFVTEARLLQGVSEACGGVPDKAKTGDFLKWFGGDVRKESEVELADAGLEWKQVAKLVNAAAAKWYVDTCNKPFEVA